MKVKYKIQCLGVIWGIYIYYQHMFKPIIIHWFLYCFYLGCPSGLKLVGHYAGGIATLITRMKHAYTEYSCSAMFCNPNGSPCCPIFWNKNQRSFAIDKACEKGIADHGALKEWITCGGCKGSKCYPMFKIFNIMQLIY